MHLILCTMKYELKKYLALAVLSLFVCCGKDDASPEEMALQTAKVYYEQLLAGDVQAFVAGMDAKDSVYPSYRAQLEENMRMFIAQQQEEHKGIASVKTMRAKADSTLHHVNAFLLFVYGDSTKEEVVVPMVERDGVWKMR